MQTVVSSPSLPPTNRTTTDILNQQQQQQLAMQSQSAQNMYAQQQNSNQTNSGRGNQQQTATGNLYRGPPGSGPNSAPPQRSGTAATRQIPMTTLYQQATMHQGVVVPTYTPFTPRQAPYQPQQYQFTQPIHQPGFYSYGYPYLHPQANPHQRAVNAGVNVGTNMTVQAASNGSPLTGPPGATQSQINLPAGAAVLTGAVAQVGGGAVLSVTGPAGGQQVGVPSLIVPVQPQQQPVRRRKHALEIIDPQTKKNILDDYPPSNTEIDYQEQLPTMSQMMHIDIQSNVAQNDNSSLAISNNGVLVSLPQETRQSLPYIELHQATPRDALNQTPIVSAMSDAPSIEIPPVPQKQRSKKIPIVTPKNETSSPHFQDNAVATETSLPTTLESSIRKNDGDKISTENTTSLQNQTVPTQSYQVETMQQNQKQQNNPPLLQDPLNQLSSLPATTIQQDQNTQNNENALDIDPKISLSLREEIPIELTVTPQHQPPACTTDATVIQNEMNSTTIEHPAAISCEIATQCSIANEIKNQDLKDATTESHDVNTAKSDVHLLKSANKAEENPDYSQIQQPIVATNLQTTQSNEIVSDVTVQPGQIAQEHQTLEKEDLTTTTNNDDDETNLKNSIPLTTTTATTTTTTATATATAASTVNETATINEPTSNELTQSIPTSTSSQKVELLINYNDGQWSPSNPSGKKQYDREQLLQLREAKASRIQPEVNNVSILPQPNLMPSFMRNNAKRVQSMVGSIGGYTNRSGGGNSDASGGNYINKQASMSGVNSRGSTKGLIHINLSLNQDVKLNETDNAWRPRVLVKTSGGSGGGTSAGSADADPQNKAKHEKEDLIKRVRGILNKLTPEKFDTLVEEIIKLKIDTPDKVEDVMVLVFEKAIDEPNFSVSYARLCHRLITEVKARDERMETGTKTNLAHFRNALLDKTEREFTQNVTQTSAKEKKLQPIIEKIKKCTDPGEKVELEALLEEEERKIRRRSGGTVRFIGELFKISMLTVKIIHSCIDTLLNPKSEDMLECLCKLLTTVGAKFEQTPINSKEQPARYYSLEKVISRMQAIASKTDKDGAKVSSRVRFMLQDVIDLRLNKWQSTRNEAPKTMEQIEKETKTEQLSSQYLNYVSAAASGAGGSGTGGSGSTTNASSSSTNSNKRDDRGNRFGDSRLSNNYGGSQSQRSENNNRRQNGANNSNNNTSTANQSNNDDSTWHVQTSKGSRSLAVDTNKLEGLLNRNLDIGSKKMGGVSQFIWNNNINRPQSSTTGPTNPFAALSSLVDIKSSSSNERNRDNSDRDRSGSRNKGSYNKNSMERERFGGLHSRSGSSQASRENSSSRNVQGTRGGHMMQSSSSMQKSASHSKYLQTSTPSNRSTEKTTGNNMPTGRNFIGGPPFNQQRGDVTAPFSNTTQYSSNSHSQFPNTSPPKAVFEEPNDNDLKLIKTVITDLLEIAPSSKSINSSVLPIINRIKESQRCGFLYYILVDYLHLGNVSGSHRRHLGNIVAHLIENNLLSTEHYKLSYEHFCEISSDLIVDIPDLWVYIMEFTGPLIRKKILSINDIWSTKLKEDNSTTNLGHKFLKTYLSYCTRDIGPNFTRAMWKEFHMQWTDYISENDVANFIKTNNFNYIENEDVKPLGVEINEKHLNRIIDGIDNLLKEGSTSDQVVDYVNGNITEADKQFVRGLTTILCDFSITYKEGSYKLDVDYFQKVCIPVLQRFITSVDDYELECLYSMQLLVHNLEHPRSLLNDLFGELYDTDVIRQESFLQWRDSKDQSAGKGVAVKGLNPFFNQILSSETSDENN